MPLPCQLLHVILGLGSCVLTEDAAPGMWKNLRILTGVSLIQTGRISVTGLEGVWKEWHLIESWNILSPGEANSFVVHDLI